ncbi:MAG: helix-turn-helix transcriptional regulator [Clostridia bacterium]|nr:helix-turn-helix transcriptional regulator [Clostridia bacterium]
MPMEIVFSVRGERGKTDIAPHTHKCHEIVFYSNGCRGTTVIGDRVSEFYPGAVTVNSEGTVHSEAHSGKGNVYFFGFLGDLPVENGVYTDMWHTQQLFEDILRETRNQEFGYRDIIDCKIREIITYIQRKASVTTNGTRDLSYCRRYIDENFMHGITLSALARISGYSTDYFRHLFTGEFGISPQQYIIGKRLDHARRLLVTTDLKCTDIAYMCGFSDSGQLTKMFTAKYGKAPLKYRKDR